MTTSSVDDRLQHLICEVIRIDSNRDVVSELVVGQECDLLDDLGLDSLLMVQLIVKIEIEFDLEFDLADLNMDILCKYNNLRDYIISHQG